MKSCGQYEDVYGCSTILNFMRGKNRLLNLLLAQRMGRNLWKCNLKRIN